MHCKTVLVCIAVVGLTARVWAQTLDQMIQLAGAQNEGTSFDEPVQGDGSVLVEYDIRLTPEQWAERQGSAHRVKRKAIRADHYRWTNKVVPYQLSNVFTSANLQQIQAAFSEWETYTCIDFRPVTTGDRNYIFLQNGGGCSSYVGMIGGSQEVSLAPGCRVKGIIVHELGHAIGFNHEQTRPDRDHYVHIHYENIHDGVEYNFQKYDSDHTDTFGVPYDYHSVMHYGKTAFTTNGEITIRTLDPYYQDLIGRRSGLSFADIKLANLMYNCGQSCNQDSCPGDGYVAKDCQCWCASDDGTGIKLCGGGGGGGGGGDCSANSQGPHDISCLRKWWADAGCSADGISSPDNDPSNVAWWNERSGSSVQADMALYFQYASAQSGDYYEKCHGNPQACPASNQGPHTIVCLNKWWEDAGCSLNGISSPDNNPSNVQWWGERSGTAVQADMALYQSYASENYGDYVAKCYGNACDDHASGPHPITCLRTWWQEAGCSPAGSSSPDNDPSNVAWWNERDAQSVQADMALYGEYASGNYADYRARCLGIGNSECGNIEGYCDLWAATGYCATFGRFMAGRCALTCGTCGEGADPTAGCADHHQNCHDWMVMGECVRNPSYMRIFCASSCGC